MREYFCPDCGTSLTSSDMHGHCGCCPNCGLSMCGGWPMRSVGSQSYPKLDLPHPVSNLLALAVAE